MKHTLLLVEDELGIRETVKIFLKSQNYEVIEAENGKEGLEALKHNDIHLAIVDIMMPVMDGLETTRNIRLYENSLNRHNIIIGLTANTLDSDRQRCIDAGMDEYLVKPFDVSEFMRILELMSLV